MENKKIKIGILLDSYQVSAWSFKMIENIQKSNYAEIKLVIFNKGYNNSADNKNVSGVRKALNKIYSLLIERNTYLPDAFAEQDCEDLLKQAESVEVSAANKGGAQYFDAKDIELIKKYSLDVLIRNGFGVLKGGVLKAAKHGVWSYHFADNEFNRGKDYGFRENMEHWPVTGSMLQILTEELAGGKILCKSFSCTDEMSVQDNISTSAWKSLSFMTRKLKELFELGDEAFVERLLQSNNPEFYSEAKPVAIRNWPLAKLIFSKFIQKIKLVIQNRLYFNQWIMLFHISDEFSPALWKYKRITPPKDRFWADPHIVYRNNKYYIFFEELPYKTNIGNISLIIMEADGTYTEPELILERPYHLSYPFIIEHEGCLYMIPETMQNNTIEMYKCVEFPNKWEFEMNLMENVAAVDATILFHNDKWWMFVNMVETEGASSWDELFLYSSDDLLSRVWHPHPLNPIVSDCHSSRPAGKVFVENGKLYRPSQNCSKHYGYGFNLNEVNVLDESNYVETTVSRVKPNWDPEIIGTHTYNREKSLHVIDAIYRRRR